MNHHNESVNGIVFSQDRKKVLLVKRRDVPVWVLPGGGIDRGESPKEAVIREVKEETGYDVEIIRQVGIYSPLCRLARITHNFECKIIQGKITLSDECQGVAFFSLKSLPLLPPPYEDWILDSVIPSSTILKKPISRVTYLALIKYLILHPILVTRFLLTKIGITIND